MTIQVDMFLSENFDMWYVNAAGEKQHPYIIHRSAFGCYERMMAMLIEKYAGAFPVWMSPVQVKILSLTDRTAQNANETADKLRRLGIRCEVDNRNEKIGYKIREAAKEKVPYMLVIGDKEAEKGEVSVRSRKLGDIGTMTLESFISKITEEIDKKVLE